MPVDSNLLSRKTWEWVSLLLILRLLAAALRFPPTKRPQAGAQKAKVKASVKAAVIPNPAPKSEPALASKPIQATIKTSIADWTGGDDDINGFYGSEKRQRGGRKKRKKNKTEAPVVQNWDDIYDPSRPNSYEEYKNSEEKIQETRDWKDRLYAHRDSRHESEPSSEDEKPTLRSQSSSSSGVSDRLDQFAPPAISFAPPAISLPPDRPPKPDPVLDDASGEDAFERRLRLSQLPTKMVSPVAIISRAPVRYQLPLPPAELPASEKELQTALQAENDIGAEEVEGAEEFSEEVSEVGPRSLRPGQKGFAARLMSKYGWTKGTGLGAEGDGIINPLRVQVEKQKKKPDSEGGGFAGPGGRGKILGGTKKADGSASSTGRFGPMSLVIILLGMVEGMDLDTELGDGNLMQEIGEECGDKYGRVERVFIDRTSSSGTPVFVKFTSELSALRVSLPPCPS